MKRLFDIRKLDIHKVATLVSVVIVVLAAVIPLWVMEVVNHEKLEERLNEVAIDVNIIADGIRYLVVTNDDWETYDYDKIVAYEVGMIDKTDNLLYAGAYRGKNLHNISVKYPYFEMPQFDPMAYPDFIAAVQANYGIMGNHECDVWFDPAGDPLGGRTMYLQYRWVPVLEGVDDPYLLIIGMSKYSVATKTSPAFYGAWLILLGAALLNLVLHMQSRIVTKLELGDACRKQAETVGSTTTNADLIREIVKEELKNDN